MADQRRDSRVENPTGASADDLRADDIAADDAGGSALGRNTGRTAGGEGRVRPENQGEVAADDAGATAVAAARATGRE